MIHCIYISMNKTKKLLAAAVWLLAMPTFAQNNCLLFDMSNREPVFRSGEKITYTLSYTVMGIWTNVGEVEFLTTLKRGTTGRSYYHIEATGRTFSFFDRIFRVRDYFATKIDEKTFQPFYKQRNINEGGFRLKSEGHFDWANGIIRTSAQRLDKPSEKRDSVLPLTPCTFDIVSLFYYYRNADFSKMKERTTYTVQLVIDNEVHTLSYRLHGREEQRVRGVGRFNTLKFSASVIEGSVFSGKDQIFFWVTDDENRIPVYMEVPIRVGSIRARINSWENLKFPLHSKL